MVGSSIAVSSTDDDLPRDANEQLSQLAFQMAGTSGFLSAYDSFHRSLPGLQARGGYRFATAHGTTGSLFMAPFQFSFLRDWRTSVIVGGIAVLGIAVAAAEGTGPFYGHDAVFTAGVSYNAGVGEEAAFRGWLYPWLHQLVGERWWLSNSIQSLLFGAAHLGSVSVPVAQTLFGFYQGWMVSRNDWNIRESIFQHFWWDVIAIGVSLLTDEKDTTVSVGVPVVKF